MTLLRFFHWGRALLLVFVLFAGFIGVLVYRMLTQRIELVRADYYQSGQEYNRELHQRQNTARLATAPTMTYLPDLQQLNILVPTPVVRGEVAFVRPSDERLDVRVPLTAQPRSFYRLSTRHLRQGFWKVRLTWSDGTHEYYAEDELTVP